MASHAETPVSKSDKNVDLDNNSVQNSSDTINLSSDEEVSKLNHTVDLTDEELNSLNNTRENGDVETAATFNSTAGRSQTEVFSFVGAEYSRDEDSPFPGEPPIKRPHSPEKLDPDNVKRKCEEPELNSTDNFTISLNLEDDSTGMLMFLNFNAFIFYGFIYTYIIRKHCILIKLNCNIILFLC